MNILERYPACRQMRQLGLDSNPRIIKVGSLFTAAPEGERLDDCRVVLENVAKKGANKLIEAQLPRSERDIFQTIVLHAGVRERLGVDILQPKSPAPDLDFQVKTILMCL